MKFIRFAESMVEKNGEGVVGMITSHGYLDNPTFRGMRWHLRQTFDAIYVLDLHGNSNKKELSPDGSEDKNVFDIKTGVAIIFGVKKQSESKGKKPLATVYRADLYGKRAEKFAALDAATTIEQLDWAQLPADNNAWYVEGEGKAEYERGFSVAELFPKNTTGIVTMGDNFIVDQDREALRNRVESLLETEISEQELKDTYGLGKNYAKWIIENKKDIDADPSKIVPLAYRPFDMRYTYFDNKLVWRPRTKLMQSYFKTKNIGLLLTKAVRDPNYNHAFVTNCISETIFLSGTTATNAMNIPLYLHMDSGERIANLDDKIVQTIEDIVGDTAPENILDYVYAVLHSPTYRAKYQEFLKSDFPRVPYPGEESGITKKIFWELVSHGRHLRELHLLTHPSIRESITSFPESGSDAVEKPEYRDGCVYINSTQYWAGVPREVWEFYIGGYQPDQKYLKDRKGRQLTSDEFENYELMVVSLNETIKVMEEIDIVWTVK